MNRRKGSQQKVRSCPGQGWQDATWSKQVCDKSGSTRRSWKKLGGGKRRRCYEYGLLFRKYGLEGSKTELAKEWQKNVHEKNCRDCMEEIEGKSSLKWYQMVKEEAGLEDYTRSW